MSVLKITIVYVIDTQHTLFMLDLLAAPPPPLKRLSKALLGLQVCEGPGDAVGHARIQLVELPHLTALLGGGGGC